MRFQTRLAIFVVLLLIILQVVNIVATVSSARRAAIAEADRQMNIAAELFTREVSQLVSGLAERARVVSLDFGFRETIALRDLATKQSVIENLRARLGSDRALLISLDGEVVVDTDGMGFVGQSFLYPAMLDRADAGEKSVSFARVDERIYGMAIVPVLAPDTVGFIGIGKEVDPPLLRQLREVAPLPLEIAFLYQADDGWHVSATTSDAAHMTAVMEDFQRLDGAVGSRSLEINGDEHVVLVSDIRDAQPFNGVRDVLTYSLKTALEPTEDLIASMVAVMVLVVLAAIGGAIAIARGVSRPVNALAAAAQRIGAGDYSGRVPENKGAGEFQALGETMNGMMSDIMAREAELAHMAHFDALTGLCNRQEFLRKLDQRTATRSHDAELSVIVVGVERLQEVNTALGYSVGDALLCLVAERLKREAGDRYVVARTGSDQFGIIYDSAGDDGALAFCSAILPLLETEFIYRNLSVDFSLRFGVADFPDAGEDSSTLFRHADQALHQARRSRSQFHTFSPAVDQIDPERLSLMGDMLRGLETGQFRLVYQPKADLQSDCINRVEALVRWTHPQRGAVFPDEFIPLAEQTGHVRELTQWVLDQSIAQMATWQSKGMEIGVGANLSTLDLMNPELPDMVLRLLSDYRVNPRWLTLEVTESAVMDDPETGLETLQHLASMGLNLAIDDYGTGYSSMSYLKRLPVREIKIDKSFVTNLKANDDDEILVRSTIDLGHNLGLKVTAEGVEDLESYRKLKHHGCDMAQGYFIARPISAHDVEQTVSEEYLKALIV